MSIDFIIVGQGLAGSCLALHLIEQGAKVMVIDQEKKHTSSWAAAGLYNPITGRKMVKTWMADELFPYLQQFYVKVESLTGSKFLHSLPIYRPFESIEEQNDWQLKSSNNSFSPYVDQVACESKYKNLNDLWGGLTLKQCGFLDVPTFVTVCRKYFQACQSYTQRKVDYQKLSIDQQEVRLDEFSAKSIIFCQGPDATQNDYFSWLPFRPVKGEILYINPDSIIDVVYNRGIFVLPFNGYCKVGSTYNHQDLNAVPTKEAKDQLEAKLTKLSKINYQVVGQRAGIRPATADRKPIVGKHPIYKTLAVFNGLGTKGVSLAPYFAHQLTQHLLSNRPLDNSVDITRYYHLYNSVLT